MGLHGQILKLYVDNRRSPSMLFVTIALPRATMVVRYADLEVRAWDKKKKEIPLHVERASGPVFGTVGSLRGCEGIGTYLVDLPLGQRATFVTITKEGETQTFELSPTKRLPLGLQ